MCIGGNLKSGQGQTKSCTAIVIVIIIIIIPKEQDAIKM
jgi:hypothetical protein